MPIENIKPFFPRLGRITAGYVTVKQGPRGPVTYPTKSETFVFSDDDRERLEVVARVLGGKVEPSPDPRSEGRFRVITKAKELDVILPADDERGWDSWWELWGSSGCLRRCTGEKCLFAIDPDTGERHENLNHCVCRALGIRYQDPGHCRPVSRLNVVVPALKDVPGLGVWQVTSRGISTFLSIQGAINTARLFGPVTGVPMTLRIVMNKRTNRATGEVRIFPTILLTVKESYMEAFRRRRELGVPPEALPAPDREHPPLGAVLTEEQMAAAQEAAREEEPIEEVIGEIEPVPEVEPEDECSEEYPLEESEPAARDYTAFWTSVRKASEAEGDPGPQAWLERVSGTTDPRQLSDADFETVLQTARAVAAGKTRTRALSARTKAVQKVQSPPSIKEKKEGRGAIDPRLASRMADQLRVRAQQMGISEEELMGIVGRVMGNGHHTTDLGDALAEGGYALFNEVYRALTSFRSR